LIAAFPSGAIILTRPKIIAHIDLGKFLFPGSIWAIMEVECTVAKKTEVLYMSNKIWKRILCVGLACCMMAVVAIVPQPQATADADGYETIAPRYIHENEGDDD